MQTFLPYPDFAKSAACLDRNRCGKQRVECLEILVILSGNQPSWMSDAWYARCVQHKNHPAVKMWRNNEPLLCIYGLTICNEWKRRGFKDTCAEKIMNSPFAKGGWSSNQNFTDAFHASHRSNLLRKDPIHYGQFGWTEPHDLPYVWPVN